MMAKVRVRIKSQKKVNNAPIRYKTKSGKKLSTNPSAVKRRQYRANKARDLKIALKNYEKARKAINNRIKELKKINPGYEDLLVAQRDKLNKTINSATIEREKSRALGDRTKTLHMLQTYNYAVKAKLKQPVGSVKIAKNTLVMERANLAGISWKQKNNGTVVPQYSNNPAIARQERNAYRRAARAIKKNYKKHNEYWGIYRKMVSSNVHIDSEQIDAAIYKAISIDDRIESTKQNTDPNFHLQDSDRFNRIEDVQEKIDNNQYKIHF